MINNELRGIFWDGEFFHFAEQTLLPHNEKEVSTKDWRVIVDAIKRLAIRGAPAIGVSAAYAAVLAFREDRAEIQEWLRKLDIIESARPTAVNLSYAIKRIRKVVEISDDISQLDKLVEAEANFQADEDENMCLQMAEKGLFLKNVGKNALTHCNTGALVSYGIGTAIGILRTLHKENALNQVYACEARPLGQGTRLTMWELQKLGINSTLLCDSAAGKLMSEGKVDYVILGADRIAANGDTANKIGTFNLAVLANYHQVPFYVAAPSTTVDINTESGVDIPVEYRSELEVTNCYGKPAAPEGSKAFNPAFDITPAKLITAIIREDGVYEFPYSFK